MDLAALHTELTTDPAGLGYAPYVQSGADGDVTRLLNVRNRSGKRYIPLDELQNYALNQDCYLDILDVASGTIQKPAQVARAARAVQALMESRIREINSANARVQAMLGALVSGGIITQAQSDGMLALADITISRAEELWGSGTVVDHLDVARALGRGV